MSLGAAAALLVTANRWPVLPLEPGGKRPLGRLVVHGLHDATLSAVRVQQWWAARPDANVGVATGQKAGIVVIDVDGEVGMKTFHRLREKHGPCGNPAWVQTGSGGWHAYYAHPGQQVPNSAGRLGAGLDVRGDGGYVVAPPSIHPCGDAYTWHRKSKPGSLPAWLLALCMPPPPPPRPPNMLTASPSSRLRGLQDVVAGAAEGNRNDCLNWAAWKAREIENLDQAVVIEALLDAALAAGLGEREARRTIASGLRAGSVAA